MTPVGRYWLGSAGVVGVAAATATIATGGEARTGLLLATALGAAIQLPLGWWLVRSLGTPHLLRAWALGMAARVGLLGVTALVLVPAFRWPAAPVLLGLAGVLFGLLLVEVTTVMAAARSKAEAQ